MKKLIVFWNVLKHKKFQDSFKKVKVELNFVMKN